MSFTIKEIESLSGIKAHTIRIWEQRYNFLKPVRTQTNIRRYSNDELKTLLTVALLNKYGFKISRINAMLPEQRDAAAIDLPLQEATTENLINNLVAFMIELDSRGFEKILNSHIQQKGIEETITSIIFGFLEKVGMLWQTNKIAPVQEHLFSNIIRQKLISAIEELPFADRQHPLFVLMLPEQEYHEMGLLYVYYLLRKNNIPVIYLGANVPVNDLKILIGKKSPAYIYLHLTASLKLYTLHKYLSLLSQVAPPASIIISGSVAQAQKKETFNNITLLQSLRDVHSFVATVSK
ncbi:MAG: MerR family transcriptional regulator [Bacteroidota bacterium]